MADIRPKEGLTVVNTMELFNPRKQKQLKSDDVARHEALWNLNKNQWYEAPNIRRGGWSGVCKASLSFIDAGKQSVFIKRQENHFYKSLRHCLTKRPTFEREYNNIIQFAKLGIPTLDVIYFSSKKVNGNYQCILVTKELEGYQSLETLCLPLIEKKSRQAVLHSLSEAMRNMHAHGYQHGSLYPKHVFVKININGEVETCFIDLEKTRRRIFKIISSIKDLDVFNRHLSQLSRTDRLRFFLTYRQEKKLSVASKKMIKTILRKKRK